MLAVSALTDYNDQWQEWGKSLTTHVILKIRNPLSFHPYIHSFFPSSKFKLLCIAGIWNPWVQVLIWCLILYFSLIIYWLTIWNFMSTGILNLELDLEKGWFDKTQTFSLHRLWQISITQDFHRGFVSSWCWVKLIKRHWWGLEPVSSSPMLYPSSAIFNSSRILSDTCLA